ncbi:MAG TPA: pyrroloquinoline quinone-dependent dehydrogenase [Vicinamibacterales bacterium]|nr:pyrroloquinoline quinone-dependent dehydrogenase [Vicinamibacterales bacterium]
MIQGKLRFIVPVLLLAASTAGLRGQSKPAGAEWTTYGGDLASTRYSPLDQITKDNFNKLEIAWRFKTDAMGPRPEFNFQVTPLMVDGVVYSTAGTRRAVVALDAVTGEMKWMHSENEGKRGESAPRLLSGRGLAYWPGSGGQGARIVYVTPGYQMVALDAKTGIPAAGFGKNGIVDLKMDDDQPVDPITGEIGLHATPIIAKDVIVVGAAHLEGSAPKSKNHEKGFIRGYDARTGKRLWIFHTIPSPGEFGNNTWEKDSWAYTGNAGVWAQMTIDEELGMVYLPVELPTGDYYGGNRPGNGLFGESVVALDLKTGVRKWHYQLVHHGIWDMDIPCAPILADITVDGKKIKAIAQITKQGWVYVFDRTNGQPVWPIEERPVEKGTVPNEWYSPTQPFVTKPPAFDRQGVSPDDVIDFTPELHEEGLKLLSKYKIGPIFTPPVVSNVDGPLGTLILPSVTGGANWQGGALDPETNKLYVYSVTAPSALGLVQPDPTKSDFGYVLGVARANAPPVQTQTESSGPARNEPSAAGASGGRGQAPAAGGRGQAPAAGRGGGAGALSVQGLPLIKPPYGRITAIDLNKGDISWQIAHGDTPDNVKNHPALKGIDIPRTGRAGRIGVLVTKNLVIAGEGGFNTTPNGQRGAMLRAYDKATGADVGAVYMPAPQTGSPMTYFYNGKQYIVVAISGASYTGELIAFKLP